MGLSVHGQETLDELEAMVRECFPKIRNKCVTVPSWQEDHPYQDQGSRMIRVVPVKDQRFLQLLFPTPDLRPHFKAKPGQYLSHLIGHKGKGSLLSELKARGWVNNLGAWPETGAKGFGFFKVHVTLSPDGQDHVEEIIALLFQGPNSIENFCLEI